MLLSVLTSVKLHNFRNILRYSKVKNINTPFYIKKNEHFSSLKSYKNQLITFQKLML